MKEITNQKKKKGTLILVPTPLNEDDLLGQSTFHLLQKKAIQLLAGDDILFCGEDPKPSRQRWSKWGLPREILPQLLFFNENDKGEVLDLLKTKLQKGAEVYLFSDGGMPAFCDPGKNLVTFAHQNQIKVSATTCDNSVILAMSLSGWGDAFTFLAFPPREEKERIIFLKNCLKHTLPVVLLDTPYRLGRLLSELLQLCAGTKRKIFLALDLNLQNEELILTEINQMTSDFITSLGKREFVLVIGPA